MPMPESWSAKKKQAMAGLLHRTKPDRDNIDKAICDALWKDDQCIAIGRQEKRYDDGEGPRLKMVVE